MFALTDVDMVSQYNAAEPLTDKGAVRISWCFRCMYKRGFLVLQVHVQTGLPRNNDESYYRDQIDSIVNWCGRNNLLLNVTKTKTKGN